MLSIRQSEIFGVVGHLACWTMGREKRRTLLVNSIVYCILEVQYVLLLGTMRISLFTPVRITQLHGKVGKIIVRALAYCFLWEIMIISSLATSGLTLFMISSHRWHYIILGFNQQIIVGLAQ